MEVAIESEVKAQPRSSPRYAEHNAIQGECIDPLHPSIAIPIHISHRNDASFHYAGKGCGSVHCCHEQPDIARHVGLKRGKVWAAARCVCNGISTCRLSTIASSPSMNPGSTMLQKESRVARLE